MKLTDDQEKIIEDYVNAQGLKIRTLRDDIIDHLCCVVESGLGKDNTFEQLLDKAISDLAPNGLIEIQDKTVFLLNSKRVIIMKKLTYLMGFIGSVSLTAGATFKLLHLPGANQLFMMGYLVFLLIFIPLLALDRFKVSIANSLSNKWKIILGVLSSVILGLAGIFKIMHLQGAHILLMSGIIIFSIGFLPFLFFNMYKKSVS